MVQNKLTIVVHFILTLSDEVLHLNNGKYALIEIKLGGEDLINKEINYLKLVENKIVYSKQRLPVFKMIIAAYI